MPSNVAAFAAKCQRISQTVPTAERRAITQTGIAIKEAWLGLAAQKGLSPKSRVAGARWGVRVQPRYKTAPGTKAQFVVSGTGGAGYEGVHTIVSFNGPVHLVFNFTSRHIIVARKLATRTKARRSTNRLSTGAGINAAFGSNSANIGTFGALRNVKSGKKALTVSSGRFSAYVFHPGTSGKGDIMPEAKRLAQQISSEVFSKAYSRSVAEAGFGILSSIAK